MMVCHFLGIGGELVGLCPSYSAAAASTGRAGAAGFLLLVVYVGGKVCHWLGGELIPNL